MPRRNQAWINHNHATFDCLECDRRFNTEQDLLSHCRTAKQHRDQWCDYCSWLFVSSTAREQHFRNQYNIGSAHTVIRTRTAKRCLLHMKRSSTHTATHAKSLSRASSSTAGRSTTDVKTVRKSSTMATNWLWSVGKPPALFLLTMRYSTRKATVCDSIHATRAIRCSPATLVS